MKTRLLRRLRKDAKRYIHLYPCGFEESYDQCFSHDSTPVQIHVVCTKDLMKKHETNKGVVEVDGVEFVYTILNGVSLSWGWYSTCGLYKAKKILRTLRREYVLQEVELLRAKQLFKDNKKEYEDVKKYILSL